MKAEQFRQLERPWMITAKVKQIRDCLFYCLCLSTYSTWLSVLKIPEPNGGLPNF